MSKYADLRIDYKKAMLEETTVKSDPLAQFDQWFNEAVAAEIPEPNAFTLAILAS